MGDALVHAFRMQAGLATRWEPGQPIEPVLEALAGVLALELTGDLSQIAAADRDRLRKVGQRALLHVGAAEDEDELDALRLAAALARDGLRALAGRRLQPSGAAAAVLPIAPEEIAQLAAGRLDGLAAGSLALRVRRDPRARAELSMLLALEAPERAGALPLAAADAAPVLDPAHGRAVGEWARLGVEAILFEGEPRRLALYASEPIALRLEGPGITTEEVRAGYWVGRVDEQRGDIDGWLHAGEEREPFRVMLS